MVCRNIKKKSSFTKVNQYSLTTLHKMQLINILNLVNNSGGNKNSACEYFDKIRLVDSCNSLKKSALLHHYRIFQSV